MSARPIHGVRTRVRVAAAAWLVCQLAAVGAAPILLHWTRPGVVAAAGDEDCCPGVAPGQVCPMHHTKAGIRHCVMRNACAPDSVALIALAGLLSVPRTSSVTTAAASVQIVSPAVETPVLRVDAPDSPPPRA